VKSILKLGITIGLILFSVGYLYTIIIGFRIGFVWGLISLPFGILFCIAEGLFWDKWVPFIQLSSGLILLIICTYFYRKKHKEGI
jgi:hypothetical protein